MESTANGGVTITGAGAVNGTDNNTGIVIGPGTATVRSQDGDIMLTGQGNGVGDSNGGIAILRLVESTGIGKVTLSGVGGNGNNSNQGIVLFGEGTVSAVSGDVTLTGFGKGAGADNDGIYIDSATVNSASFGKVMLTGKGSGGTASNSSSNSSGIRLKSGTVRSENGDIALIGTGLGTDFGNYGINLGISDEGASVPSFTVEATGTGNISLTGEANTDALAIKFIKGLIDAGGNVTLTGDSIELSSESQVNGTGIIQLQPLTTSFDISVGGGSTDGRLNLSSEEVTSPILNGFSQLIIGHADGTGKIEIDAAAGVEFKSLTTATTIQAPISPGSIAVNGRITAKGGITFNGATSLSADVSTIGKNITFNSPVTVENKANLNTGAGGGNILFKETVDGKIGNTNSQNLTLITDIGNITFSGDVGSVTSLGNLQIESAGNVQTKAITAATASITQTADTGTTALKGPVTTNAAGGINLTGTNFAIDYPVKTLNSGTFKVNNSGELNIATGVNLELDGEFTQSGTGRLI